MTCLCGYDRECTIWCGDGHSNGLCPQLDHCKDPRGHHKVVSQCVDGCGCNLLFIECYRCDLFESVDGWPGCNVDWAYYAKEEPDRLLDKVKDLEE